MLKMKRKTQNMPNTLDSERVSVKNALQSYEGTFIDIQGNLAMHFFWDASNKLVTSC